MRNSRYFYNIAAPIKVEISVFHIFRLFHNTLLSYISRIITNFFVCWRICFFKLTIADLGELSHLRKRHCKKKLWMKNINGKLGLFPWLVQNNSNCPRACLLEILCTFLCWILCWNDIFFMHKFWLHKLKYFVKHFLKCNFLKIHCTFIRSHRYIHKIFIAFSSYSQVYIEMKGPPPHQILYLFSVFYMLSMPNKFALSSCIIQNI